MRQLTFWTYHPPAVREVRADAALPSEGGSLALPYPGTSDLEKLALWLSHALIAPVSLTFTRNRSTMVSFRHTCQGIRLRLHRVFLQADAAIMQAAVDFVRGTAGAGRILDRFVLEHPREVPVPAMVPLRALGDFHDLEAVFDDLNSEYFHEGCRAHITWGTPRLHKGQKAPVLGMFRREQRLIVVHPCLDAARVPRHVVSAVVFHQMLHELFNLRQNARGRCLSHPGDFLLIESSHPDHARSAAWLQAQGAQLKTSSSRTGPRRQGARKAPICLPGVATG